MPVLKKPPDSSASIQWLRGASVLRGILSLCASWLGTQNEGGLHQLHPLLGEFLRHITGSRSQHFCICQDPTENMCHYLLACPLYLAPREKFLGTALASLGLFSEMEQVLLLPADVVLEVSYKVALSALAAKKNRAKLASK